MFKKIFCSFILNLLKVLIKSLFDLLFEGYSCENFKFIEPREESAKGRHNGTWVAHHTTLYIHIHEYMFIYI